MPEVKQKVRKPKTKKSEEIRDPEVPTSTEPVPEELKAAMPEEPKAVPEATEEPKEAAEAKPATEPAPKPVPMAKPVPSPKPVPGKLVTSTSGNKTVFTGPDPRAMARVVAAMLGINPKDSKFFLEHVGSVQRKEVPVVVCMRCGVHIPKANVMHRLDIYRLIMEMRDIMPMLRFLTPAVFKVEIPKKYVREDLTGIGGFCPGCVLAMGNAMPPMFRIPEYENENAPELRSLILDVIQANRVESAIVAMKKILREEDEA